MDKAGCMDEGQRMKEKRGRDDDIVYGRNNGYRKVRDRKKKKN